MEHIVIDEKLNIHIPESLKTIPQYNHNVQTYTIDCPRYTQNGEDMMEMVPFISVEKKGEKEPVAASCSSPILDETDETIIHFDWTIRREVTDTDGKIGIVVCVRHSEEENLENAWHTFRNEEIEIKKGIDCGLDMMMQYPGLIEEILYRLGIVETYGGAVPDKTLTISGAPADAKVVGDRCSQLQQTVNDKVTNPKTAIVGQILAVKAVDENGKPTEFEALDNTVKGVMTANAKALFGTLLYATVYDKDVLADPKTVIDSFLAELDKTVSPEEPDVPDEPDVPTPTTYSVVYNLTSVTSSNKATTVTEGASYTTVLSSDSTIDKVVVKMGGVDITETAYNSTSKTIIISEVTGNIEITASIADSSLLYQLKDASFNGQTIVDTGVALFDEPKDFTILFDFENMSCENSSYFMGFVEDENLTDSYNYFIGRNQTNNKNAENETIEVVITAMKTTVISAPKQSSGVDNRYYSAKLAVTFDSSSNKWNGYVRNTKTNEYAENTITKAVDTITNNIAIGGVNYRGKSLFECNEFSIYNRILSADEINAWMQ